MNVVPLNTQSSHALPYGYAWLAEHALESNLFFEPAFLLPSLQHLAGEDVSLCVARDEESGIPLAALPVLRTRARYGPMPTPQPMTTWLHPYAMLGTPLVSRETPERALRKLLDTIGQRCDGAAVLLLPMLQEKGPVWPLLRSVVAGSDRRLSVLRSYQRAGLNVSDPGSQALGSLLGKNSVRSHKISGKRLAALGQLEHRTADNCAELTGALEAFFALEAAGWKGREGTALKTIGHDRFAAEIITELGQAGRARIDQMILNDKPIAATVSLQSAHSSAPVWMPWKTAYDETYAQQGAGAYALGHLTERLLQHAAGQGTALHLDSLASPDSVIANRLWRQPQTFVDIAVDLQAGGSAAFSTILMAERARDSAYKAARYARDLVASTKKGKHSRTKP